MGIFKTKESPIQKALLLWYTKPYKNYYLHSKQKSSLGKKRSKISKWCNICNPHLVNSCLAFFLISKCQKTPIFSYTTCSAITHNNRLWNHPNLEKLGHLQLLTKTSKINMRLFKVTFIHRIWRRNANWFRFMCCWAVVTEIRIKSVQKSLISNPWP